MKSAFIVALFFTCYSIITCCPDKVYDCLDRANQVVGSLCGGTCYLASETSCESCNVDLYVERCIAKGKRLGRPPLEETTHVKMQWASTCSDNGID